MSVKLFYGARCLDEIHVACLFVIILQENNTQRYNYCEHNHLKAQLTTKVIYNDFIMQQIDSFCFKKNVKLKSNKHIYANNYKQIKKY